MATYQQGLDVNYRSSLETGMPKQRTTKTQQQSQASRKINRVAVSFAQPQSSTEDSAALWLLRQWLEQPGEWEVVGDDLGTTFACCGAVLAVAALLGDRTGFQASVWTELPIQFCKSVCTYMSAADLWCADWFLDLRATLLACTDVEDALNVALEHFWHESDVSESAKWLCQAKAGYLVGGARQTWQDTAESFAD